MGTPRKKFHCTGRCANKHIAKKQLPSMSSFDSAVVCTNCNAAIKDFEWKNDLLPNHYYLCTKTSCGKTFCFACMKTWNDDELWKAALPPTTIDALFLDLHDDDDDDDDVDIDLSSHNNNKRTKPQTTPTKTPAKKNQTKLSCFNNSDI